MSSFFLINLWNPLCIAHVSTPQDEEATCQWRLPHQTDRAGPEDGAEDSDFFLTSLSVGASDRCRPVAVCWASLSPHGDPDIHVAIRAPAGGEGYPEEGPGLGRAACVLLTGQAHLSALSMLMKTSSSYRTFSARLLCVQVGG